MAHHRNPLAMKATELRRLATLTHDLHLRDEFIELAERYDAEAIASIRTTAEAAQENVKLNRP